MNTKPSFAQTIAAFDLDGTLTTHDTLLPFLLFSFGYKQTYQKMLPLLPAFGAYGLGMLERQAVKEKILTTFFQGMPHDDLLLKGAEFAQKELPKLIKKKALARLEWHRKKQHSCLIVSAAIDVYIKPWADAAGFDDVLCSQLAITPEQTVTGRLEGLNCWGPEKIRRLIERTGPLESYTLYAYGDSRGDHELLAAAHYAFLGVFPQPS